MVKLSEIRKTKLLTQEELAHKCKITTSTVNRLEKGKQKPRFATIKKLAKVLCVEPSELEF